MRWNVSSLAAAWMALATVGVLGACSDDDEAPANAAAPVALTAELCDDASNMDAVLASPSAEVLRSAGVNQEQVDRMIAAPTEGPFYMVNLIRYREQAVYADGRETDLTGREANALYAPIEFLSAIGANIVFNTAVDEQIDGDDPIWDDVAIVEYPCPVAFFAMLADPDFQARAIHKDAGVEETIVLVTDLVPVPTPSDPSQSESPFPPTEEDPAFDLIHVMDFHDIAQYEPDANEPERTGQEAWELYQASGQGASATLGIYLTGKLEVQGAFIGDGHSWDEVVMVHMPSKAGFQALLDDPTRQEGRYHRLAALANNYSMITFPQISQIPGSPGGGEGGGSPLPVASDGTGTPCETDADCPGDGVEKCLSDGGVGFCTREGCGTGECPSAYLCCHDCSEQVQSSLPFAGSACFPEAFVSALEDAPVSCTCD